MKNNEIATEHRAALASIGWTVGEIVADADGSFWFTVGERITMGGRRGRDRIVIPAHTRRFLVDGSLVVTEV